jgi:hypothetical protein
VTIITAENFIENYEPHIDKFWSEVDWFVGVIMAGDRGLASQYERRVRNAPVQQQILVYHESPLHVALDLCDQITLTEKQRDLLRSIGGPEWRPVGEALEIDASRRALPKGSTFARYLRLRYPQIIGIGVALTIVNLLSLFVARSEREMLDGLLAWIAVIFRYSLHE